MCAAGALVSAARFDYDPASMASALPARLQLSSGRTVSYALFGAPEPAQTIVYFHGFPGSHRESLMAAGIAERLGIRVLSIDRPGIGYSDPVADRTVLDWVATVNEVADRLSLGRFAAMGVSGGTPYALACAAKLPARVTHVLVVSGMGPPELVPLESPMNLPTRVLLRSARGRGVVSSSYVRALAFVSRRAPTVLLEYYRRTLSGDDRRALRRAATATECIENISLALRQGGRHVLEDFKLLSRPWGFALDEVRVPVRLWHGEDDALVPAYSGRAVADALPQCRAEYLPERGHFMVIDILPQIFRESLKMGGAETSAVDR